MKEKTLNKNVVKEKKVWCCKDDSGAKWFKWGWVELSPKSSGDIFKIMQEVVKR